MTTADNVRFAVVTFPEADRWGAYVMCEEGPTNLLPAPSRAEAVASAQYALDRMLSHIPHRPAEIWTAETTAEIADDILAAPYGTMFDRMASRCRGSIHRRVVAAGR
jgi:hypothetical protein